METKTINPGDSLSLFVKSIFVFEERAEKENTALPFFADGYPGLMFQQTKDGLFVKPHEKKMPLLFLYGQTIKPIELHMKGAYQLIVFQLYPFVLKNFFAVSAKDINDGCYGLQQSENAVEITQQLLRTRDSEKRIAILACFLNDIFNNKKDRLDFLIKQAIQLIIKNKGQASISELCRELPVTERTFERRFSGEVGVSPKQFSQIIQFQQSLVQLTSGEHTKLTDIVYTNGFADQSHFIRVFKAFTGKTPTSFLKTES